jgi:hypothetical protein
MRINGNTRTFTQYSTTRKDYDTKIWDCASTRVSMPAYTVNLGHNKKR